MSRVAIFFADGFEEIEALTPVDILRRGGIDTVTVSIGEDLTIHGSHNIDIKADIRISELDFDSVDMIVLPGGKIGHQNLEVCKVLTDKIAEFNGAGKFVAAICAAPTILGRMGILKGHDATCYGGMEAALEGANKLTDSVVVSGNIITSRGMGTSVEFGLKLLEVLTDKANADRIAASVMVPGF